MLSKDFLKAGIEARVGKPPYSEAVLYDIANLIAGDSHFGQAQRSGAPYILHPQHVAMGEEFSLRQRTIAILHDVIEEKENAWTVEDLQDIGFPQAILRPLAAVSRRSSEPYFDFIERLAMGEKKYAFSLQERLDAIAVKKRDFAHNSDNTRYMHFFDQGELDKADAYNVAYFYLSEIEGTLTAKRDDIGESFKIIDFMQRHPAYSSTPESIHRANELLERFSSTKRRVVRQVDVANDLDCSGPHSLDDGPVN